MSIQNKSLSGAEHDYFSVLSGLSASAPLTEHKAKVFSDSGFGGTKPLTQMEREWLQNFANSSKINEGDLWLELVSSLGITPSPSTSENKFRFYTSGVALLQGSIRSIPDLVAYYPLDESSGDAINKSPSTLGTLDGTVTGATQNETGLVGKAYSFDGSDDVITPDMDELDNATQLTIMGFVNPSTTDTRGFFAFRNADTDDSLYILALSGTSVEYRFRNSAGNNFDITPTLSDITDSWGFFAVTYDGDTLTAYHNGSSVGTNTNATGGFGTSDHTFYIARDDQEGRRISGLIQHVAIFDRGLSSSEISKVANIAGIV